MVGLNVGVDPEKLKAIVASNEMGSAVEEDIVNVGDGTAVVEINTEELESGNDWRLVGNGVIATSVATVEEKPWVDAVIGTVRTAEVLFNPFGTMLAVVATIEPLMLVTSLVEVDVELLENPAVEAGVGSINKLLDLDSKLLDVV